MRKEGYAFWGDITKWALGTNIDKKVFEFRLDMGGYNLVLKGQICDIVFVPNDVLFGIEEEETGRTFYHQLSKMTFEKIREKE